MRHTTGAKSTPIGTPSTGVDLAVLPVFVAVAREASFAGAARRLGLDRSRVSRVIATLESALGQVLFVRTTRSVRATPEALELLERVEPALATLHGALDRAGDRSSDAPRGEVVVTSSPEVARELVAPLVPGFRTAHPGVHVRLVATESVLDLAKHGIDLALRLGRPGQGSGVARRIATLGAAFYAAPSYLERRGVPRGPDDLARHEGLWPSPPRGTAAFGGSRDRAATAAVTGDFAFLAAVARAGGGIALLPSFLAEDDVARGQLVRVLDGPTAMRTPLYLVTRSERPLPARVTALQRTLVAGLARGR